MTQISCFCLSLNRHKVRQPWPAIEHDNHQLCLMVHPWAEPALIHFMQLQQDPSACLGYVPDLCLGVSGFMNLTYSHIYNYNRKVPLIVTIISGIYMNPLMASLWKIKSSKRNSSCPENIIKSTSVGNIKQELQRSSHRKHKVVSS